MKRLLLITVALLLSVSSWAGVLAASLCPHMQREHACCAAKAGAHQHGQMMAHHEGMTMEGMEEMIAPATSAVEEDAQAITQPESSCEHCMSRSEPPVKSTIVARSDNQTKKELRAAPAQTHELASPFIALSASPVTSRQNAPPGESSPRHVLINVFRI